MLYKRTKTVYNISMKYNTPDNWVVVKWKKKMLCVI